MSERTTDGPEIVSLTDLINPRLVEYVAKALYDRRSARTAPGGRSAWEEWPDDYKAAYLDDARAALAAFIVWQRTE